MFPGEKSPGLIEARAARSRCWRSGRCFRGRNPPASLKRLAMVEVAGRRRVLFPGEKSPGLIEALLREAGPAGERGVSGGEIPRPH